MAFKRNKKYELIALYSVISAIIVIAVFFVFFFIFLRFDNLRNAVGSLLGVLSPFIYGFIFAYIANPLMLFFEQKILRFPEKRKILCRLRRGIAVFFTVTIIILFIALLFILIVPQITNSYDDLQKSLGGYLNSAQDWANDFISNFPLFKGRFDSVGDLMNVAKIQTGLSSVAETVVSSMGSFVVEMKNIFIGAILAVYFLLAKDKIAAQTKKLLSSLLSKKHFINLYSLAKQTDRSFGQFIRGKLIDSLIIGLLTFVVLWIFKFPFYPLIAVIVGVTNVIPVVGPFIGAIPSAFLILIVEPKKVIWFIVIIIIIQQLDGNLIGPKILGNATGLSAMWVIIAVTLGGSLFGIGGMFFAVPLMSVIYALVREGANTRLRRKKLPEQAYKYYSYPPEDEMPKNSIFLHNDDEKDAPFDKDDGDDGDGDNGGAKSDGDGADDVKKDG